MIQSKNGQPRIFPDYCADLNSTTFCCLIFSNTFSAVVCFHSPKWNLDIFLVVLEEQTKYNAVGSNPLYLYIKLHSSNIKSNRCIDYVPSDFQFLAPWSILICFVKLPNRVLFSVTECMYLTAVSLHLFPSIFFSIRAFFRDPSCCIIRLK